MPAARSRATSGTCSCARSGLEARFAGAEHRRMTTMVALAQTGTDWLPRAGRIATGALVAGVGNALAAAIAGALAADLGLPLPPVAEGQDPVSGLATSVALGASA